MWTRIRCQGEEGHLELCWTGQVRVGCGGALSGFQVFETPLGFYQGCGPGYDDKERRSVWGYVGKVQAVCGGGLIWGSRLTS